MSWINLLVFLHVMSAIFLVAGIVGRQLTRGQAQKASDIKTFVEMSALAGRFENLLVRPNSMIVVVIGIILAVMEGWPLFGFLQGGISNWLFVSNLLLLSMVAVIVLIYLPRGKIYDQALQDAVSRDEITPKLQATFHDPVVQWAHRWEEVALVLIIFLMVVKPF